MNNFPLLIILLVGLFLPLSYAQSLENDLTITISTDGVARITENLDPKITTSSIEIQLISDKISNMVATDEKNIFLNTAQNGDLVRIDSLGASQVTLTYNADIVSSTSGIWRVTYNSNIQSTVILPPLSNIVSVNNIPIDIIDDSVVMPPGQISLSYTIRTVTENNFVVSSDNLNYFVQVMTASKVGDFKQDSKSIMLTIDDNAPVLVLLPKAVISGPYEVQLNGNPIEFKQYYQNGTHSWIRIEPFESGSIKIIGIATLPTEPEPVCGAGAILKDGVCVVEEQQRGGGCLIATATYGSELAPQVQFLREIRDNTVLQTASGTSFMSGFNAFYYSFSPTVADWERENPVFKEAVKITITPLITTLSILQYADIDSEEEMLGYGISIILLNIGMYLIAPTIAIIKLKKHFY